MSLTISLQSALASLNVTQAQMQIVSNNVANASTEGFTRKTAAAHAQIVNGLGAGVRLGEVERIVDENLLRQLRDQLSRVGNLDILNEYHGRIQDFFGTPGSDTEVSHLLGRVGAALESLSSTPELAAGKFDVISHSRTLTERLTTLTSEIQEMRHEVDTQISASITTVNDLLTRIQELNIQIGEQKALGRTSAELEDSRDVALADLAEQMDIYTYTRPNGHVVVLTPAGRPLVDIAVTPLSHNTVATMDAGVNYPNSIDGIHYGPGGADITTEFQGGKMAGIAVRARPSDGSFGIEHQCRPQRGQRLPARADADEHQVVRRHRRSRHERHVSCDDRRHRRRRRRNPGYRPRRSRRHQRPGGGGQRYDERNRLDQRVGQYRHVGNRHQSNRH